MLTEEQILNALKLYHQGNAAGSPLEELLLWQRKRSRDEMSIRRATNEVLHDGLSVLATESPALHRVLELRFLEDKQGSEVAPILDVADGTVWRLQREGIELLTGIIQRQEESAYEERRLRFRERLELPTSYYLFGVDEHLETLVAQVNRDDTPWLIALEGIGGIGKTTLANALMGKLLHNLHWQEVAWITARQQIFNGGGAIKPLAKPALSTDALVDALVEQLLRTEIGTSVLSMEQKRNMLQSRLQAFPHLIVIDNLETLLDIETLLGTLREWVNPTKFLLTSRVSRYHETDIFHFTVPALSRDDTLAMLRTEATNRNLPDLANASDADLDSIHETVGGNPLALRLVVGQIHIHALGDVLADLRNAKGQTVEQFYHFIYWKAWHNLDPLAQRTLLLMPLVPETGGELSFLGAMAAGAGLSAEDVGNGLERLRAQNLVDGHGDLHTRRYMIHALTRSFLQEQVLKWGEE